MVRRAQTHHNHHGYSPAENGQFSRELRSLDGTEERDAASDSSRPPRLAETWRSDSRLSGLRNAFQEDERISGYGPLRRGLRGHTRPGQDGTSAVNNEAINSRLPRPSNFPVGSPESRAAARAMAEWRIKGFIRVKVVYVGLRGGEGLPPPERIESEDSVTEIVHLAGSEQ